AREAATDRRRRNPLDCICEDRFRLKALAMEVPYFDLKAQYDGLREDILAALDRVCRTASFILGEEVERFEEEFAAYCGVKHCVAVNTGTSALHLALLAVGVQPGDEVITTPNTFIATAEAISYVGARPVFVDIRPASANLDPERIETAITARTRAIVPVHLYGRPADLDPILAIAARHDIPVVEDACQAPAPRSPARASIYPRTILGPKAPTTSSRSTSTPATGCARRWQPAAWERPFTIRGRSTCRPLTPASVTGPAASRTPSEPASACSA